MADSALQGAKLKGGVELKTSGLFAMLGMWKRFGWRRMDGRHENGVAGDGKQWQFTTSPASCHASRTIHSSITRTAHANSPLAKLLYTAVLYMHVETKITTPSPRIKMMDHDPISLRHNPVALKPNDVQHQISMFLYIIPPRPHSYNFDGR